MRFETRDSMTNMDVENGGRVGNTRPSRHETRSSSTFYRVSIAALAAIALAGCGNIEPWVKPYERAALADPLMMPSRHPVADDFTLHVFEVREAARGASGSAGGGCGCN